MAEGKKNIEIFFGRNTKEVKKIGTRWFKMYEKEKCLKRERN